jgi:hypothetical protein
MATLYVTEFQGQGLDQNARSIAITAQPPVAEQTVAIGASSAQSNAFNNATNIVRLHTDAICSVEFGTNPTSAATKARMAANQTEYFFIPSAQSYKVAVITNT